MLREEIFNYFIEKWANFARLYHVELQTLLLGDFSLHSIADIGATFRAAARGYREAQWRYSAFVLDPRQEGKPCERAVAALLKLSDTMPKSSASGAIPVWLSGGRRIAKEMERQVGLARYWAAQWNALHDAYSHVLQVWRESTPPEKGPESETRISALESEIQALRDWKCHLKAENASLQGCLKSRDREIWAGKVLALGAWVENQGLSLFREVVGVLLMSLHWESDCTREAAENALNEAAWGLVAGGAPYQILQRTAELLGLDFDPPSKMSRTSNRLGDSLYRAVTGQIPVCNFAAEMSAAANLLLEDPNASR